MAVVASKGKVLIGLDALSAELAYLARDMDRNRLQPSIVKCAAIAQKDVSSQFRTHTSFNGQRWHPLARPRLLGGSGGPLTSTGKLAASVKATAGPGAIVVSSTHPHADALDRGIMIKPRKAKFLALPLTPQAARSGPRQFGRPLFLVKGKGGKKSVLAVAGPNKSVIPQYVLVKQVRLPARPFLGVSVAGYNAIEELLLDAITAPVTGV